MYLKPTFLAVDATNWPNGKNIAHCTSAVFVPSNYWFSLLQCRKKWIDSKHAVDSRPSLDKLIISVTYGESFALLMFDSRAPGHMTANLRTSTQQCLLICEQSIKRFIDCSLGVLFTSNYTVREWYMMAHMPVRFERQLNPPMHCRLIDNLNLNLKFMSNVGTHQFFYNSKLIHWICLYKNNLNTINAEIRRDKHWLFAWFSSVVL
jgi:hypothetical protein